MLAMMVGIDLNQRVEVNNMNYLYINGPVQNQKEMEIEEGYTAKHLLLFMY